MAQPRGRLSRTAFTTTTPQKRGAPPATPLRQSKRTKSTSDTPATNKTTPKKSEYFEQGSDLSGPSDLETTAENASNFEGDEDSAAPSSESEDGSDAYDSEEEQPKRRRSGAGRTNTKAKAPPASKAKGQKSGGELWREGTKVEADPGTEVYIALPKARGPGSTPYRDDTIHPNTMLFLGDLKKHNDRAWLKAHDPDFRQSQKDFASFVDTITERLMSEYDDTLPELPAKDLVFRIYRDVRFSKDPTPYKTHFAAAWSRTGRKGEYAHYYVQIAPGECFVGGGKWMPEKPVLDQLRQDVTDHPKRIRKALLSAGIRKHYLGDIKSSEDQAVKAFRKHNEENAFKRTPQVDLFVPSVGLSSG